jgi:uncharacterized protein
MNKNFVWAVVICLFCIGSCVTVNIYFPASAAQKAAETIIEDIQGKEKAPEQQPEKQPQKSGEMPKQTSRLHEGCKGLSFGPTDVYAAEADLDISTPAITAIRESLKARYQQLKPYFESGVLGLANNGQIAIRDASGLPLKEKATLNNLVGQHNKDLLSLYQEIARANKLGLDAEPKLQKTFADSWRQKAQPGRWIQTDAGAWVKK